VESTFAFLRGIPAGRQIFSFSGRSVFPLGCRRKCKASFLSLSVPHCEIAVAQSVRPSIVSRLYASGGAALVGVLGAGILFAVSTPIFLSIPNLLNIGRQTAVVALISVGMTFVVITGGIDLSVGSVVGLSGTLAAAAITESHLDPVLGALVGLGVGALIGLINGAFIALLRVPAIVTTLATLSIARGVALQATNGHPISGLTASFAFLGRGEILGAPAGFVLAILIYIFGTAVLRFTTIGRHILGLGGNEEAARLAGLPVKSYRLGIYVLTGLLSGFAGLVLMSRLGSGQPTAGAGLELSSIAAVVLGGTRITGGQGTLIGTFLGALLITILGNGLDLLNVGSFYQLIFVGVVLLVAVVVSRFAER
jgi:ribose transport system permease protein